MGNTCDAGLDLLCECIDEVEYEEIRFFAYELGRCVLVRRAAGEVMRGGREARLGFEAEAVACGGVEEDEGEAEEDDGRTATILAGPSATRQALPAMSCVSGYRRIWRLLKNSCHRAGR